MGWNKDKIMVINAQSIMEKVHTLSTDPEVMFLSMVTVLQISASNFRT